MITRKNRFHGYNSLRHVYKNGETVRGDNLAIKAIVNDRRVSYRCAVVVAKKVSKSAVVRNRIRRRLYEIVRHEATNITKPYDIVITAFHPKIAEMDHTALQTMTESLLAKAGVTNHSDSKGVQKNTHDIIDAKES